MKSGSRALITSDDYPLTLSILSKSLSQEDINPQTVTDFEKIKLELSSFGKRPTKKNISELNEWCNLYLTDLCWSKFRNRLRVTRYREGRDGKDIRVTQDTSDLLVKIKSDFNLESLSNDKLIKEISNFYINNK